MNDGSTISSTKSTGPTKKIKSSTLGRRKFLQRLLGITGMSAMSGAVPFLNVMSPTLDVEAERTTEIDLSGIAEGQFSVFEFQGAPLYVVHRDKKMIGLVKDNLGGHDPQPDSERVIKEEWLIVKGVCSHLGCSPTWAPYADPTFPSQAWHCRCHGSKYDFSGRVIKSPAPRNLEVPPVKFLSELNVLVGTPDEK